MTSMLQEALDALEKPEPLRPALDALLRAWEPSRDIRLINLIEQLGQRFPPPAGELSSKELPIRYLEIAAADDPTTVSWLAENLSGTASQVEDRFLVLSKQPADPRILGALLKLVCAPPFQGLGTNTLWTSIFDYLCQQPDPRIEAIGPRIDAIRATISASMMGNFFRSKLKKLVKSNSLLLPQRTPPGMEDQALITQLEQKIASLPRPKTELAQELFQAIQANPASDEARLVFADMLMESGNPRGQFIALQLTPDATSQAARLLKIHRKDWLGGVAPSLKLDSVVWERGFPVAGELGSNEGPIRRTIGHRDWWSFKRLSGAAPYELLAHPVLEQLEQLEQLPMVVFIQLLQYGGPPLKRIHLRDAWRSEQLPAAMETAKLPLLEELGLFGGHTRQGPENSSFLFFSKTGLNLKTLMGFARIEELVHWLPVLRKLPTTQALNRVVFCDTPNSNRLELLRTLTGWTTASFRLAERPGYNEPYRLIATLDGLPDDFLSSWSPVVFPKNWLPHKPAVEAAINRMLLRQPQLQHSTFQGA